MGSVRVFVTGASGMIGSWLTSALVDRGWEVTALLPEPDPRSHLFRSDLDKKIRIIYGRIEDSRAVERCIAESDPELVFHLGAQTLVGVAFRSPVATFESNIQGTWNVLEAARNHKAQVRRVVVASSDKAYGIQGRLPYTESMPLQTGYPYEVSKACTDLISQSYFQTYGLPVCIVRLGNVFGGGDLNWTRLVPGTIRALLSDEVPVLRSDGSFIRDYLYVKDAVAAYLAIADQSEDEVVVGRAFNFSNESPMTVSEMYTAICLAVGVEREPVVLGEATGEIHDQYLDATRARESLGWSPSLTLDAALEETVPWYAEFLNHS